MTDGELDSGNTEAGRGGSADGQRAHTHTHTAGTRFNVCWHQTEWITEASLSDQTTI